MNFKSMLLSSVVSVAVLAGERNPAPAPARLLTAPVVSRAGIPEPKLACPAGTNQGGGQASLQEASFCERVGANGLSVIHGPFLVLHPNGKTAVEGQYVDGKRTGLFRTFDATGAKVEEVTFTNDLYNGPRAQWVNGRKAIEETYLAGKRQGDQRTWDAAGNLTVVRYVDDRPVAK